MFRLLKLAAMGLLGYALFEFFRGLTQEAQAALEEAKVAKSGSQRSKGSRGAGQRSGGRRTLAETTQPLVMTGPGEGIEEATADADGGSVSHKVGRGVIS